MYTSGPTTPVAEAGTGRALPVIAITVLLFGLSFGLLSREAGITPLTATVMSLLVAAGSTQIGALTALAAGAPTSAAILAGLTLSLRYIPLGVVVGAALPRTWWRRLIDVHLLTDQGIMLGRRLDGTIDVRLYRLAGLVVLVTWVSGTAAGRGVRPR